MVTPFQLVSNTPEYSPLASQFMSQGQMEGMPQAQFMTPYQYGTFRTMPTPANNGFMNQQGFLQSLSVANRGSGPLGLLPNYTFNTYNPAVNQRMYLANASTRASDMMMNTGLQAGNAALSAMTMLLPGGLIPGLAIGAVTDKMLAPFTDRLRDMRSIQYQTSPMITFGSDMNQATGAGFSAKAARRIDKFIKMSAADDTLFKEGDYREMMRLGIENGMFDYAHSADQYKDVLKKIKKSMTTMMEVVGSSDFKDIMGEFKRMQTLGADPTRFNDVARKEQMFARMAGMSHSAMVDTFGQQGAVTFASKELSPIQGSLMAMNNAATAVMSQRLGIMDPASMARIGGVSGMAQRMTEGGAVAMNSLRDMIAPALFAGTNKGMTISQMLNSKNFEQMMYQGMSEVSSSPQKLAEYRLKGKEMFDKAMEGGGDAQLNVLQMGAWWAKKMGLKGLAGLAEGVNQITGGRVDNETAAAWAKTYLSKETQDAQDRARDEVMLAEREKRKQEQNPFNKFARKMDTLLTKFGEATAGRVIGAYGEAVEKSAAANTGANVVVPTLGGEGTQVSSQTLLERVSAENDVPSSGTGTHLVHTKGTLQDYLGPAQGQSVEEWDAKFSDLNRVLEIKETGGKVGMAYAKAPSFKGTDTMFTFGKYSSTSTYQMEEMFNSKGSEEFRKFFQSDKEKYLDLGDPKVVQHMKDLGKKYGPDPNYNGKKNKLETVYGGKMDPEDEAFYKKAVYTYKALNSTFGKKLEIFYDRFTAEKNSQNYRGTYNAIMKSGDERLKSMLTENDGLRFFMFQYGHHQGPTGAMTLFRQASAIMNEKGIDPLADGGRQALNIMLDLAYQKTGEKRYNRHEKEGGMMYVQRLEEANRIAAGETLSEEGANASYDKGASDTLAGSAANIAEDLLGTQYYMHHKGDAANRNRLNVEGRYRITYDKNKNFDFTTLRDQAKRDSQTGIDCSGLYATAIAFSMEKANAAKAGTYDDALIKAIRNGSAADQIAALEKKAASRGGVKKYKTASGGLTREALEASGATMITLGYSNKDYVDKKGVRHKSSGVGHIEYAYKDKDGEWYLIGSRSSSGVVKKKLFSNEGYAAMRAYKDMTVIDMNAVQNNYVQGSTKAVVKDLTEAQKIEHEQLRKNTNGEQSLYKYAGGYSAGEAAEALVSTGDEALAASVSYTGGAGAVENIELKKYLESHNLKDLKINELQRLAEVTPEGEANKNADVMKYEESNFEMKTEGIKTSGVNKADMEGFLADVRNGKYKGVAKLDYRGLGAQKVTDAHINQLAAILASKENREKVTEADKKLAKEILEKDPENLKILQRANYKFFYSDKDREELTKFKDLAATANNAVAIGEIEALESNVKDSFARGITGESYKMGMYGIDSDVQEEALQAYRNMVYQDPLKAQKMNRFAFASARYRKISDSATKKKMEDEVKAYAKLHGIDEQKALDAFKRGDFRKFAGLFGYTSKEDKENIEKLQSFVEKYRGNRSDSEIQADEATYWKNQGNSYGGSVLGMNLGQWQKNKGFTAFGHAISRENLNIDKILSIANSKDEKAKEALISQLTNIGKKDHWGDTTKLLIEKIKKGGLTENELIDAILKNKYVSNLQGSAALDVGNKTTETPDLGVSASEINGTTAGATGAALDDKVKGAMSRLPDALDNLTVATKEMTAQLKLNNNKR